MGWAMPHADAMQYPVTPDGRYFVVRGRLWRCTDPNLGDDVRAALTRELMAARRAKLQAMRASDAAAREAARRRVDAAKVALGERGPVWWTDGAPDCNRRLARTTRLCGLVCRCGGHRPGGDPARPGARQVDRVGSGTRPTKCHGTATSAPLGGSGRVKKPATTKPDERQPALTSTRHLKMAESAHAYVRGSTVKFYEWLESSKRATVPEGPPVWICGDCHVGNLGPIASAGGKIEIQIRDLDQTVIGNPAHDLIRLGLSLAMAARSSDLPGVTTARIIEHLTDGYQAALAEDQHSAPSQVARHRRPHPPRGGGAVVEALGRRADRGVGPDDPARQAVLAVGRRRAQGDRRGVRPGRCPRPGLLAAVARRREHHPGHGRGLLAQGLQLARAPALRGPARHREAAARGRPDTA